jgi:hypothetical protein
MKTDSKIPVVVTLLIVGLANAAAVWLGLTFIGKSIERQQFYSSSSPSRQQVITLSNDRFAVVEGYSISVYQVDSKGKITRVSDVNTQGKQLVTRKRYEYQGY